MHDDYDDTSVNGNITADEYEDDGEPWDCDLTYPEESEDDDEDEES